MSANRSLTAQFTAQYTLTLVAGTGGTVTGGGVFDSGSTVPIVATPSSGYRFVDWSEAPGTAMPANSGAASTTMTMYGSQTLTANFAPLTPPVFTSPNSLQILVVGQPYTFTATATYSPTFSATGLPPGITMAASGVISGTPTTLGSYTATLTATNSSGSATQSLPFIVYPVPVINPPLAVTGKLNEPFTNTITATGSPTAYGATGLPSWLKREPRHRRDFRHADRDRNVYLHHLCLESGDRRFGDADHHGLPDLYPHHDGFAGARRNFHGRGCVRSEHGGFDLRNALLGLLDRRVGRPGQRGDRLAGERRDHDVMSPIATWSPSSSSRSPDGEAGPEEPPRDRQLNQGTLAPITATPAAGYRFTGWSGLRVTNSAAAATTVSIPNRQP